MKKQTFRPKTKVFILTGLSLLMIWGIFSTGFPMPPDQQPPSQEQPAKSANEAANKVLETMTQSRKVEINTLETISEKEILVLGAKADDPETKHYFDYVQKVLDALKIPYTPVSRADLENYDTFKEAAALLCNCLDVNLSEKSAANVKTFLSKGGYLFTTDWCIESVIQKVAPGYIKYAGVSLKQGSHNMTVNQPEKQKKHIFLRDVFPAQTGVAAQWLLDQNFKYFEVVKPNDVTLLIEGDEGMKKEYKQNEIAACWTYNGSGGYKPEFSGYQGDSAEYLKKRGKNGVILHVISHFDMQTLGFKDVQGNSSMYQLIANFLIDAKLAKQFREAKKK